MPNKRKRKRAATAERPTIHPRNKYSDNPPDFAHLASLYPSFQPHVFYSRDGRPRIDWTDFNATRELTRVLLLHDHGLNWWIPDGQLCPTVPNRSNYIHWIEDLLSSDIISNNNAHREVVRGFDIGTGANCIYPLLGASLLGWSFVGSDMTDVGIEWAEKNVESNPHISDLIEIRRVDCEKASNEEKSCNDISINEGSSKLPSEIEACKEEPSLLSHFIPNSGGANSCKGPPILFGVVRDDETFDFCMCNPPFFESMEEAGLNPKTSCGGTPQEMVCPGGEKAFISRIIKDSIQLKQSFRWYTSMVGRKANLKILISELREAGATIVKTTEFVQGQTCRWGLAWSFMPPSKKMISSNSVEKSILSFMLEGLQRQSNAIHVLQSVESFFCKAGASCKMNTSAFTVDITVSADHYNAILKNKPSNVIGPAPPGHSQAISNGLDCFDLPPGDLPFRIAVFQQTPGTLLVRGSLKNKNSPAAGVFSLVFTKLEVVLKDEFCREKVQARY